MNHKGLSSKEAKLRLEKYGPNEIKEGKKVTWYEIFLRQFIDIMVVILIIAGGISIFAREYLDAGLILGIVFLKKGRLTAWSGAGL